MIKEIHNHSKGIRSGIGSRCGSTKILNPEGLSWKRLMQECIEALKGAENLNIYDFILPVKLLKFNQD